MMMSETVKPVLTDPFVLYQSALLSAYAERLNHGFTGKGAGELPFTLGGPGFEAGFIRENRLTLCRVAGLNESRLSLPRQTHTDRYKLNDLPCEDETDAVIVTEPGVAAMVQVADCVPVILYAPDRHVGAVVHAGWRGTAQGITHKVATVLIEEHQAAPEQLIAAIGPSIGGCCYEISEEVAEAVAGTVPHQPPDWYREIQPNGKPRVDLKKVNALQLRALGLSPHRIEILNACTRCLPDALWSFRRNESGRQVGFLQLMK
jgi:YfiH family protein